MTFIIIIIELTNINADDEIKILRIWTSEIITAAEFLKTKFSGGSTA